MTKCGAAKNKKAIQLKFQFGAVNRMGIIILVIVHVFQYDIHIVFILQAYRVLVTNCYMMMNLHLMNCYSVAYWCQNLVSKNEIEKWKTF